ncbi:M1 family metallopeptidase [Arenimonas sp. GDDSR-1]|uniref:M1 family metallopeptidase n=1 Tax=Arenimonas sp. GDDSR-1 TaxID=2950125 RepID=UPI002622130A|nr:M1 family metallopeptidase [Arenimonas sp. GDDSR-1]
MFRMLIAAALALVLTACKPAAETAAPAANVVDTRDVPDPNSYATPDTVRIQHLVLDLRADMVARTLAGSAELHLKWADEKARELVLDTRDLQIGGVQGFDGKTWKTLPYRLDAADAVLGSALRIKLPSALPRVRIRYSTVPQASGLQWLTPEMTSSKQPFMFSQSQAIHARSWVPLQDTPGVRFTYDARIRTDAGLMALMSADNDPKAVRDGDYRFSMPQKIPSYLLAIAVGDVVFKPISSRSGVWAEPGVADAAAAEFADTEKMIQVAEKLYGPYQWGRYDMLILPASFPFGGMENPRLSFITPTVIVGDKSLTSLIAHELAHSWSGNLVTNSSWKDIWLNEGFTSYVENRIVEQVYGRELADMENVISQAGLAETLKNTPPADQVLALPPLAGRDPDEALSDVAYIKGQWFLMFLEQRFGRETFDAFLRHWFTTHAFTSSHSTEFERFLTVELLEKHPGKASIGEVREWLHDPGIPSSAKPAVSTRFDAVDKAQAQWLAGDVPAGDLAGNGWGTQEWVRFLERMPPAITVAQATELDAALHFSGTPNPEIAQRWYPLTVRSGYTTARPAMEKFLTAIGRRKLIMPIYGELAKSEEGRAFAAAVFEKARPGYHPITSASVTEALKAPAPEAQQP